MNKTQAARKANIRKAAGLQPELIEAFRYAPEGMHLTGGEAARFLAAATDLAPEGSIKIYLKIFRDLGEASQFYRMFASRRGPSLTRHNAMHPDKPGVWCNREGPPVEPVEPAPPPEPEPEPEPVPEPAPQTAEERWPAIGAKAPLSPAEQHDAYNPFE